MSDRNRFADVESQIFDEMRSASSATPSISLGVEHNPDVEAKYQDLSKKTGAPLELIRQQPDIIEKQANAPDPYELAEKAPKTLEFYQEPDNAAIAHDDHQNLSALEELWNKYERISGKLTPGGAVREAKELLSSVDIIEVAKSGSAILKHLTPTQAARYGYKVFKKAEHSLKVGQQNVESGRLHTKKAVELLRGNDTPELDRQIEALKKRRLVAEEDDNFLETGVTGAVEMIPLLYSSFRGGIQTGIGYVLAASPIILGAGQAGPQAAVPIDEAIAFGSVFSAGTTVGTLDEIFQIETGLALEELLEVKDADGNPMNPQIAAAAAFATGSINTGLEYLSLRVLSKIVPGGEKFFGKITTNFAKNALQNPTVHRAMDSLVAKYGKSVVAEATTEMTQEAVNILATHGAKEVAQQVDNTYFTGKNWSADDWSRVMQAGYEAMSAQAFLGLPLTIVKGATQTRQAQRSLALEESMADLNELIKQGKLKERSAEAAKRHLDLIGAGKDVWIDHTFFQDDSPEKRRIAEKLGLDPEQTVKDAKDGQDIRTTVSQVQTGLEDIEIEAVKSDIKESPGAMTPRQVREFDLDAEAKRIDGVKRDYDETSKQINRNVDRIRRELINSGYSSRYAKDFIGSLLKRFTESYNYTPQQQIALYRRLTIERVKEGATQEGKTYYQAFPKFPQFYSQVLREVESPRFPNRATGKQFKSILDSWIKKGQIKAEEVDWIGVREFLDETEGKISKDEVVDFVNRNQVEVEIRDLSELEPEMPNFYEDQDLRNEAYREFENDFLSSYFNDEIDDEIFNEIDDAWTNEDHIIWNAMGFEKREYLNRFQNDDERAFNDFIGDAKQLSPAEIFEDQDYLLNLIDSVYSNHPEFLDSIVEALELDWNEQQSGEGVKYAEYTIKDGEEYREILFIVNQQLPPKEIPQYLKDEVKEFKEFEKQMQEKYGKKKFEAGDMTEEDYNRYLELEQVKRNAEYLIGQMRMGKDFKIQEHWDNVANIVAHLRLTSIKDNNLNKTLVIEEMQSDLHQQGRKEGYVSYLNKLPEGWKIEKRELGETGQVWQVLNQNGNFQFNVVTGEKHTEKQALSIALDRLNEKRLKDLIPQAPFEKSWSLMVLKNVVRMAADEGFDKISWTTGAIQNERWNLYKRVQNIRWNPETGELLFKERGRESLGYRDAGERVARDRIDAYIGQELADKMLAQAPDDKGFVEIQGDDIKVEGKGMIGFYDKILPSVARKFFGKKKWGSPRIAREKIDVPGKGDIVLWSMPLTEEIKKTATREGFALFQENRGSVTFASDQYLISLFEGADPSTAIHETAHIFLNETESLVNSGLAEEFIVEDHATVRKWLGAKEGETLTTEQHEQFARGFERYLWEGVAPTKDMESVFARFAAWLRSVYKRVEELNVDLTDEMREVFGRMLAHRQELDLAGQLNEFTMPDKAQLDALGVVTEDRNYMERLINKAYEVAEIAMGKDRNKNRRKNMAKWKKEAEEQVRVEGYYDFIATVKENGAINKDALIDEYGEAAVRKLPRGVATVNGKVAPTQAVVGSVFGSPDDMMEVLTKLPPMTQAVKARVEMMDKAHDSQYNPIDYLVETKEYGAFLEIIAKYQDRNNRGVTPQKAFKVYAKQQLENKPVREAVRHDRFLSQMKKHARIEADKTRQQKWADAAQANEHVRLNYELTAGAVRTRKMVEKTIKRMSNTIKAYRKNHHLDEQFAKNLFSLAERFNLADIGDYEGTLENKMTLEQVLADSDSAMSTPGAFLPIFTNERNSKDYRDLTVAEMEDLDNLIKHLIKLGRDKKDQWILGGTIKASEGAAAIYNEGADIKPGKKPRDRINFLAKIDKRIQKYFAELDSLPFVIKAVGGFKDIGQKGVKSLAQQYIIDPLIRAQNEKLVLWEQVSAQAQPHIAQLVQTAQKWRKQYGRKMRIPGMDVPELLRKAGQDGYWLQEQIFAVILNLGNESNIKRLYAGYGGMNEPGGLSETTVERMKDMLSKADWDAIQGIWDTINSLHPQISQVHQRMNGYEMAKIEAQPVETKFGTYPGGYYPAKYDGSIAAKQSLVVGKWEEAEDLLNSSEAIRQVPEAKSGFVQKRKDNVALPLKLSLSVTTEHLMDTVHYITHAEAVRDVDRITRQQAFIDATVRILSQEHYDMIRPALKHIARPRRVTEGELHVWVERFRRMTIPFILAWNASVAVKQWFSTPSAIFEIGPIDYLRGVGGALRHPISTFQTMKQISPYIRQRATNMDRELHDQFRSLSFNQLSSIYGPIIPKWEFLRNAGFWPIRTMDMITVIPIWNGAYKKEFRKSGDMQKAVDYADKIVRETQPSAQPLDLNQWQRMGGAYRALSMFQTFTVGKYGNRQRLHYRALFAGKMNPMDFAYYLLADAIVPAASMVTLLALLQGRDLDDEFMEELPEEILKYTLLTGMPVISDIWSPYSGPLESPIKVVGEMAQRVVNLGGKAIDDFGEVEEEQILWSILDAGSLMSGIPVSRVLNKAYRGAEQEDRSGLKYLFPTPKKYRD